MQRTAYILGASHIYQRADKSCEAGAIAAFLEYLQSLLNAHGIKAIGEEASAAANADWNITDTIPAKFASKHGIHHRYCDPSPEVAKALGIVHCFDVKNQARIDNLSADQIELRLWKEDLKREPYWLTKIQEWDKEQDVWPILFVCGPSHVNGFSQLLTTVATEVHIAHPNWLPNASVHPTPSTRGTSP
jgi:hypothetical protein